MSELEMTVSTYPNDKLHLKDDIELIKVGLLYSEKVTLKSIKADLFYRVLDYSKQTNILEKMYYMKDIAVFGKNFSMVLKIDSLIAEYQRFIKSANDKNRGLARLKINKEFTKPWSEVEKVILNMFDMKEIKSLEKVIESEKLNVIRYKTPFKDSGSTDKLISEYMKSLEDVLSLHYNYPLFDTEISKMVNSAVKSELITITNGTQERMKHSNLTMTMLRSLPSFEKATIDEVVDIRKELDSYLIKFRSAIIRYTDLINGDIIDEDLYYEIDKLIMKEINPIIQEIDEEGKRNNYLKELGYTFINSKLVQVAGVGLILGNVADIITGSTTLATGIIGSGQTAISHHKEWKDKKRRIEENNLFFYYKAQEEFKNL